MYIMKWDPTGAEATFDGIAVKTKKTSFVLKNQNSLGLRVDPTGVYGAEFYSAPVIFAHLRLRASSSIFGRRMRTRIRDIKSAKINGHGSRAASLASPSKKDSTANAVLSFFGGPDA